MNFYIKYWKDRNEKLHNVVEQKKRIIDWYRKKRMEAINREYPQIKKYIEK